MKYLDLLSKFWSHNETLPFGSSAAALYTLLVHRWHENKYEDFMLSDIELSKELKLKVNTIKAIKKKLQDRGLIQFQVKIGLPSSYKIVTDNLKFENPEKKQLKEIKIIERKHSISSLKSKNTTQNNIIRDKVLPVEQPKAPMEINVDIPSLDEFLSFAKTLQNYVTGIDLKIEDKYNTWLKNDWKNGYNRPITNWKLTLKSTMPYIIESEGNEDEIKSIPTINRPTPQKND